MATDPEKALADGFNRLRGQLAGMIESFGLPARQERGAISTLKTLSYENQAELAEWIRSQQAQK